MNKLTVLSAAILAGFSSVALSAPPPAVPDMYQNGPSSLQFQGLNLSVAEKAGYALAEGTMDMAEAAILAKNSCALVAGSYDIIDFYASGDEGSRSLQIASLSYLLAALSLSRLISA